MPLWLSRRQFASRTLGAGLGAAALGRGVLRAADDPPAPARPPEAPIQLNSNENPYGPSPAALAAMTAAQGVAARYPGENEERLVEAIAAAHGVGSDQVLLGCGSGEILRMADMAFLGPDKSVVAAEPTFEAVLEYARVTRARAVKVPQTSDHRHDLAAMAAACDAGTGLVYVCNPNNPTGTIVRHDELARFLEQVPRSCLVLLDEAYFHFVRDESYRSGCEWPDQPNLVVVRTFSKVYGLAGMRLGYALGSRENIAALREHAVASNTNAAVLEAALASLQDWELVPRERERNVETRAWLCQELARDGRRYIPSHTNFVMFEIGSDVEPLIEAFRQEGILVGRRFPSLSTWLRISIGTRQEMAAFVAALRRLAPAASRAA
jgi:histidinol-phosphate aminotransferase